MTAAAPRGTQTRERLVQAGIDCLVDGGWAAVTHRRVAARAEVNAGLVHYHLGGLPGLRAAIAAEAVAPLTGAPDTHDQSFDSWLGEIASMVDELSDRRRDVVLLLTTMIGALSYPEVREVVGGSLAAVRDDVRRGLDRHRPDAGHHRRDEIAAAMVALIDGAVLAAAISDALPTGGSAAPSMLPALRAIATV